MEETLPPGFRFHPTDEELITFYLNRKVADVSFTSKAIVDVDLNKSEPWDLPGKASMGEKEWYFFSLKDRKYPTGLRTNRATEAGYWKTTGKDKEIYRAGVLVGMKKTLVFYKGRAPRGEKSNWVMHEYRLQSMHQFKPSKDEWVVCRVFQKSQPVKKPQQTQSSQQLSPDSPYDDTNSMANEFGDVELPNLNSIVTSSTNIGFNDLSLMQGYPNMNNENNLTMNMNLASSTPTLSPLTWPSSLLGSNLAMNSLLLKALQVRSYQQREATSSDYSYLTQGVSQFVTPDHMSSNFQAAAASSSARVLDALPSQQGQPEQSFNMDSIW